MKRSKALLILAGVCLASLIGGFLLGQHNFVSDQGALIETRSMKVSLSFSPETSALAKEIGTASLRFYVDALTACLNEPENLEKINSIKVLSDFVVGSCMVNALRPRIKGPPPNSDEKTEKKNTL